MIGSSEASVSLSNQDLDGILEGEACNDSSQWPRPTSKTETALDGIPLLWVVLSVLILFGILTASCYLTLSYLVI